MMEVVLVKHLLFPVQLEKAIRLEEQEAMKSSSAEKISKVLIVYACCHASSFIRNKAVPVK